MSSTQSSDPPIPRCSTMKLAILHMAKAALEDLVTEVSEENYFIIPSYFHLSPPKKAITF